MYPPPPPPRYVNSRSVGESFSVKNIEGSPDTKAILVHKDNIDYIPKVSVVIPIYNTEEYLKQCLDSIVNQTLREIEIICVNDGSTDSSLDIIKSYAAIDDRISIICQENLHAGVARNAGLSIASGESIIWLDSDDYYKPQMFEKLYNKLIETASDIAICQYDRINLTDDIVTQCEIIDENIDTFSIDTVEKIFYFFSVPPYNKLYNLNFVKNNNFKYSSTKVSNDISFTLATRLMASSISVVHENLAVHRNFSNSSVSKNRGKYIAGDPIAMEDIYNFMLKNKFFPKYKTMCLSIIIGCYFYELDFPIDDSVIAKFKKNLFASNHFLEIKEIFLEQCKNQLNDENTPIERLNNIKRLHDKKKFNLYDSRFKNYSFLEKILSVKNEYCGNGKIFKVFCIFGLQIKIRNKLHENKRQQQQNLASSLEFSRNCLEQISVLQSNINNLNCQINSIQGNVNRNYNAMLVTTVQPVLESIAFDLAEHCNLRCRGCDHFAPLAEKKLTDLNQFEIDIKRYAKISNSQLSKFKLMGGEPLLNPQIIDFMRVTREYLPNTRILIVTNGILLPQQKEDFWKACNKYNVIVAPTKYPLKIQYEKVEENAKRHDVKIEYYNNTNFVLKTSGHYPIDMEGQQKPIDSFFNCFHNVANLVFFKNGKIYPCTVAPNIRHFNKYFGTNVLEHERDSIDIHKVNDISEVLEFLSKPIPFCRYCNVRGRTFGHEWGRSKKQIEEWT